MTESIELTFVCHPVVRRSCHPVNILQNGRSRIVQAMMALAVCRRFSASGKTIDCGPSITASVTSRAAVGRQAVHVDGRLLGDLHPLLVADPVLVLRR